MNHLQATHTTQPGTPVAAGYWLPGRRRKMARGASRVMFWFLEREQEVMICEIRRADDGSDFELAISGPGIPERIERFDQPGALIERWLGYQQELRSLGWMPRHVRLGR